MKREELLTRQLRRLQKSINYFERVSGLYSRARLSAILAAVLVGLAAIYYTSNLLAGISFGIVFLVFGTLTYFHGRLKRSLNNFSKMQTIHTMHLNRLQLSWADLPERHLSAPAKHPFAFDLDLYGESSLLRLIDQTGTRQASGLLELWLSSPELALSKIIQRQNFIRGLSNYTMFRDKLFMLSMDKSFIQTDTAPFLDWLARQDKTRTTAYLFVLSALAIVSFVLFLLQSVVAGPYWMISLSVYIVIHLWGQLKLAKVFNGAINLEEDLRTYQKTFLLLENFKFKKHPVLNELIAELSHKATLPSKAFRTLKWNVSAIGIRMNPVMAILLNIFFPWDYLVAQRLGKATQKLKNEIPHWFEKWFQFDALASMAQFAWLHPDYTFAEISERQEAPYFEAVDLGHPLLRADQRKSNDFSIGQQNSISLLSGSNMSGKSTFLRTVGINLVLAFAGAPLCAKRLRTILLRLHSCIRINDSLSEGLSYFYAEVKRLKEILISIESDASYPVLFLIDEIFKGTNNRERLIGSRSYIYNLSSKNGIGLISTHDLELAALENEIANLKNFHFREDIADGKMHFDYKLRSGSSPTTNALKIMELEGLPVTPEKK